MNRISHSSLEKSVSIARPTIIGERFWTQKRLRIEVDGPEGHTVFELNQPFARIGSHPASDIRISPPQIARRHLYLQVTGNRILGIDFDRSTKSGKRVYLRQKSGLPIVCGAYRITPTIIPPAQRWAYDDSTSQPPIVKRKQEKDLCALIQVSGKDSAPYAISNRLISVGRHPTNKVSISSERVSEFHCILFSNHDKIWAIDLRANYPTLVAGRVFDSGHVPLGMRVQIGPATIVFDQKEKLTTSLIKVDNTISADNEFQSLETRVQLGVAQTLEKHLDKARKLMAQLIICQATLRRDRETFEARAASVAKTQDQQKYALTDALSQIRQQQLELDKQQADLNQLAGELTNQTAELKTRQTQADEYLKALSRQRENLESTKPNPQTRPTSGSTSSRKKNRWRSPLFTSKQKPKANEPDLEQGIQCQLDVLANIQRLRRSSRS